MEVKTVYLVTHGEYDVGTPGNWKPDPPLNTEGWEQIQALKPEVERIIPQPAMIQAGTGRRHLDVAWILGYHFEQIFVSDVWGGPIVLARINDVKHVLLACGEIMSWEQYLSSQHLRNAVAETLRILPHNTLICSGRPVLVRLGLEVEECRGAAIYALRIKGDEIKIERLTEGVKLNN